MSETLLRKRVGIFKSFLKNVDYTDNILILDCGCADGTIMSRLITPEMTYIGLDIAHKKLLAAKELQKDNASFICSDAQRLPFKDEQFDAIICSEVLEHVDKPLQMAGEISRVLREGGTLIFTIPNGWGLYCLLVDRFLARLGHLDVGHKNFFSLSGIRKTFNDIRLDEVDFKGSCFLPDCILDNAIERYLPKLNFVIKVNLKLGDMFPSFASGWYFKLRKKKS